MAKKAKKDKGIWVLSAIIVISFSLIIFLPQNQSNITGRLLANSGILNARIHDVYNRYEIPVERIITESGEILYTKLNLNYLYLREEWNTENFYGDVKLGCSVELFTSYYGGRKKICEWTFDSFFERDGISNYFSPKTNQDMVKNSCLFYTTILPPQKKEYNFYISGDCKIEGIAMAKTGTLSFETFKVKVRRTAPDY